MVEKTGPWVKNEYDAKCWLFDTDLQYLRGSFKVAPTCDLDITLRADTTRQRGNGGSAYRIASAHAPGRSC